MNRKVIKTMLYLVVIFLAIWYVAKIFFPERFIMTIENPRIISLGNYVDNNIWAYYIFGVILGCVFDFLYFGAVCETVKLKGSLLFIILAYNLAYNACYTFLDENIITNNTNLFIVASSCYMIFIPMFYTNKLRPLAITYSVNCLAQNFSLNIRNLSLLLTTSNFMTMFLMTAETYLWVFLCLLLFNYKGGEKNGMGETVLRQI